MTTAAIKTQQGRSKPVAASGQKPKNKRFLPLAEYKRRQQAETDAFRKKAGA